MTDFLKQLLTDLPWSDEFAKRLWEAHEWQEMHVEDPKMAAEAEEKQEESFESWSKEDAEEIRQNISESRKNIAPGVQERITELLERQVELLEALVAAEFSSQQTTDKMLKIFLSSSGASSESDPFKAFSAQRLLGGNGLRSEDRER